jgi:hypothetical protein
VHRYKLQRLTGSVFLQDDVLDMFWRDDEEAYCFERRADYFEPIFSYIQSESAYMQRPKFLALDSFIDEILFFGLEDHVLGDERPKLATFKNENARRLYEFVHNPLSSCWANLYSCLSLIMTILSISCFVLETDDSVKEFLEPYQEPLAITFISLS